MHIRFDRFHIKWFQPNQSTHVSCKVSDRLRQLTYNSTVCFSRPEIDPSRLEVNST